MARKKIHFYVGSGNGPGGHGTACPIYKLHERLCTDTHTSDDPSEVTCRQCQVTAAWRAAIKKWKPPKMGTGVEELEAVAKAILEQIQRRDAECADRKQWPGWPFIRSGMADALHVIRERVRKLRQVGYR